jgi:hypothetical protein
MKYGRRCIYMIHEYEMFLLYNKETLQTAHFCTASRNIKCFAIFADELHMHAT